MQIARPGRGPAKIVRAHRQWRCESCGGVIPSGTLYVAFHRWEGDRDPDRFCWPCVVERKPEIVAEYDARRKG